MRSSQFRVSRRRLLIVTVLVLTAIPLIDGIAAFQDTMETSRASTTTDFDLTHLAWMAGTWGIDRETRRVREHWFAPVGNTLIGMSRTSRGSETRFVEFMSIVKRKDGVWFTVSQGGLGPKYEVATLRATTVSKDEVVFENPKAKGHDASRIAYRRRKGGIAARVSHGHGEAARHIDFTFKAVANAAAKPKSDDGENDGENDDDR